MKAFPLHKTVRAFLHMAVVGILVVAAASAHQAQAAQASSSTATGAKSFIANMGQQALDFLGDAKLGQSGKEQAFRHLLESSFDMNTIGRFALGQYWRQMNPQQQKEYLDLFREHVVRVYSARFNEYSGQQFQTTGARADSDSDTIVTSSIISPNGAEPVEVDWRVRFKGGHYQIVDVMVEGVSMTMTQRSDFASVIQRGGGDPSVIIEQLRKAG